MPSVQIRNISDSAYENLKARAKQDRRSVQQEAAWLLESILSFTASLHRPNWQRVDELYEQMKQRYGTLPDSTPLIREMRDEH